jgi:hypothetical protein
MNQQERDGKTTCDDERHLHHSYHFARKLLETLEALLKERKQGKTMNQQKPECDHTDEFGTPYNGRLWQYAYCPKCGEKL